jgi:hypothetical protein
MSSKFGRKKKRELYSRGFEAAIKMMLNVNDEGYPIQMRTRRTLPLFIGNKQANEQTNKCGENV